MATIRIRNVSGVPIQLSDPFQGLLKLGQTAEVQNYPALAIADLTWLVYYVRAGAIRVEYIPDNTAPLITDIVPTPEYGMTLTTSDDRATSGIRRGNIYKMSTSINLQINTVGAPALTIGGISQEVVLLWPTTVQFTVASDTPLGLNNLVLQVNGRQVSSMTVNVCPPGTALVPVL